MPPQVGLELATLRLEYQSLAGQPSEKPRPLPHSDIGRRLGKRLIATVFAFRLNDPTRSRIDFLPQNEVQLGGMVLDMAHVVQK